MLLPHKLVFFLIYCMTDKSLDSWTRFLWEQVSFTNKNKLIKLFLYSKIPTDLQILEIAR